MNKMISVFSEEGGIGVYLEQEDLDRIYRFNHSMLDVMAGHLSFIPGIVQVWPKYFIEEIAPDIGSFGWVVMKINETCQNLANWRRLESIESAMFLYADILANADPQTGITPLFNLMELGPIYRRPPSRIKEMAELLKCKEYIKACPVNIHDEFRFELCDWEFLK